jgi:hypothetical protein
MKKTIPGRCAIYFNKEQLVVNATYKGDIRDGNAYENVTYEERDGKLYIDAEQLQPGVYNELLGPKFGTDRLEDLHASCIKTKWVHKYWLFGPLVEKRYAESGWQRLKDNKPEWFVSTNYTIIHSNVRELQHDYDQQAYYSDYAERKQA